MTQRSKHNLIRKVFFDLNSPGAYAGAEKVFLEAHRRNPKITRSEVKEYLQSEDTYTIYKPKRNRFPRLKTIPSGLHSDWQTDLAIFDSLRKNNDGHKYLLVAIDVLSRKIITAPVLTKSPMHMIPAFELLFKKAKVLPHKIYSDRGLEFQSRQMLDYFESKGIQKHVIFSDDIHAGAVERANRTIKGRLYRYFHQQKTHRWVDVIDRIVDSINASPNRTTGVEPNKFDYRNAESIRTRVYGEHPYTEAAQDSKPKYKKGDIVRISKSKGVFSKGYHPNFTKELFRIKTVRKTIPPHYKIEDMNNEEILGRIYEPEISKVHEGFGGNKIRMWEKL